MHAPVDTDFFSPAESRAESREPAHDEAPYFLVVSALVPYKRVGIAIAAAAELGARVKIIGTGPEEARLRAAAGARVEFLGTVSGEALRDAYRGAIALVLPAVEDFGIAPVESLACGRPVVALGRGGVCETVEHGVSGLLVDDATVPAFAAAMRDAASRSFDPARLRARAEQFSTQRFEAAFRQVVQDTLETRTAC